MNSNLYLVAEVGDIRFAIDASLVDSVVSDREIVPVPLSAPAISGLCALRSRVITVVDTLAAIEGYSAVCLDDQMIIVIETGGHHFGLQVDDLHDVVNFTGALQRLGASFAAGWQRVSTGVIEVGDRAIVVIDPARLVADANRIAA